MKMTIRRIREMKIALFLISFLVLSGFLVALFQNNIIKIKADTWSIMVSVNHLAFGTVFPGEQLQKNFTVFYSGSGNGEYTIVEKYKPFDPADSDYCQDNFSDFDKCYKYLCPYIEEYSIEGEGDTVTGASVSSDDLADNWIVTLDTPAIVGNISQDHTGGIISVNGVYGCDLSFDVEIEENEPYCGDGNLDPGEQCDDGNNINGDGCSADCKTEGGGGGGGGGGSVLVSLQINNAEDCVPTEDGAYFSWKTNMASSSRVVCDTKPNPDWGTPPDYGYFLFTDEYNLSPKILNHEVEIPGLVPGESYYCRVISSNGSSTVFEEVICSIPDEEKEEEVEEEVEEEGEVKGTSTTIPSGLPRTGYGGELNLY